MNQERRLIEEFIPIKEISKECARENSIRKGHISTLHKWWARRPLVAARAAVYASLVAAPDGSEQLKNLTKFMIDLCRWEAGGPTIEKAKKHILEAQKQRLGLSADTPLTDVPPPIVLDMFAGRGPIPLEALRLGCETHAIDLNPVAHIIELCALVYPQKYGKQLAVEVEKWGNWVIDKVREEIGDLYPEVKVGKSFIEESEQLELLEKKEKQLGLSYQKELTPFAYLWTRTVKCPNPDCGATVPLVRQTWLCKKNKKYVALKVVPNFKSKKVEFEVVKSTTAKGLGFDPCGGNFVCRHCGTTVSSKHYIQEEGKLGKFGQQLMSIVCTTPGKKGKTYLSGTDYSHYVPDEDSIKKRLEKLCAETGLTVPNEPTFSGDTRAFFTHLYGLDNFGKLFTTRQLLSLMTFVKWVKLAHQEMLEQGYEEELGKAIATYLAMGIGKCIDLNSSLNRWKPDQQGVVNTFSRQALPMVWDYAETNVFGDKTGAFKWSVGFILNFILREKSNLPGNTCCNVTRATSTSLPLSNESLDAVITDPPYFDSVPYADLSDYFYVWFKRSIGHLYPEHFSGKLTPKKKEAIMKPSRHGGDKVKAAKAYEDMMHQAFKEANRVLKVSGIMTVVYAHKTTGGWSTLIDSLRRAGFTITEAWPLETESKGRPRAQNSAALASSIFLIARKRTNSDIGDYAMDVQPQLREIVRDRVKALMSEGVTGADLVIACIGAGLRAYTQYDSVELPNGDPLDATTFLDEVQTEVLETILSDVLQCEKQGVSAVDKPTQYYILGRYEYGEAVVEFDEANTLARGVGIELTGPGSLSDGKQALVSKNGSEIQLLDYSHRGELESLGLKKPSTANPGPEASNRSPALIDILHRLLWLLEHSPDRVNEFLASAAFDFDTAQLRLVAQALAGRALTPDGPQEEVLSQRTREQQAIDTLLASWKRVVPEGGLRSS